MLYFQVPPRQKLLAEGINSPDKVLSVGARRTFLLKSQTFKEPGNVTSFWAYFVTGGEGQFQVWRPLPGPNQDTFRLVGKKDFAISLDPPATPRFMQVQDYSIIAVYFLYYALLERFTPRWKPDMNI